MKKLFLSILLILALVCFTGCGNKTNEKTPSDNSVEHDLTVYIFSSGTSTVYFTKEEVENIKSEFLKISSSDDVEFIMVDNSTDAGFGDVVNNNKYADVVIGGKYLDHPDGSGIPLMSYLGSKLNGINSKWCSKDNRFIGIVNSCKHLELAKKLVDMLVKSDEEINKPDLTKEYSVLFIGNSYTYYNNMPVMFRELCESKGIKFKCVDQVTGGGKYLSEYIDENDDYNKQLVNLLSDNQYDFIFLQEQSSYPVTSKANFEKNVRNIIDYIRNYNPKAEFILYETWARNEGNNFYTSHKTYNYKTMEQALLNAYSGIAGELELRVSYPGVGMYLAHEENKVRLYQDDNTHPAPTGSYLVSLLHANLLFGINPLDVEYVPEFKITAGGNDKKHATLEECEYLRRIAYQTIKGEWEDLK